MIRKHFLLPSLLLLGACTTVGPDYYAPETPVADHWLAQVDDGAVDPAWWQQFGDPELTALIERALAGSPTVAEAQARLAEARANRAAVEGRRLPELRATGSATENRLSENGQLPAGKIPGFETEFSLFDLGFDASWELDFWGRRTREVEGAEARVGAAEARLHDALVMLTAEIARNYIDLRAGQARVREAEAVADSAGELSRLNEMRYRAGEGSKLEADLARAEAASAHEAVSRARTQADAAAFRLSALVGESPEAIVPALRESGALPLAPETILVGLRSDLLRRRPDVRLAERELAAATADVGVATADLFPRFSLIGGLGTQSRSADSLLDAGSIRFSLGPSFAWPIFSGGRIRAQIHAADARADAAAARFERAVAEALADSESAINRYLETQAIRSSAAQALAAHQDAFHLAEQRFRHGEDDKLTLERARLELASRDRELIDAQAEASQAAIAVYKALGAAAAGPQAREPGYNP